MTARERSHLLRVLRGAGLELVLQPQGYYVARCPSCGGRLEVHPDAPSPDLALVCMGRVELRLVGEEVSGVH